MSLETNIIALKNAIVADIRDHSTSIAGAPNMKSAAVMAALTTPTKNLVSGLNEAYAKADSAAVIDDASPSATTVYSGTQTEAAIAAAITNLVGTSPVELDTLQEIATAINDDQNFATTVTSALALKANTADIKTVAELGATVDTTDYAADYIAARDAV